MAEDVKLSNRICLDCGNSWLKGDTCPKCGSNRFVEREITSFSG